MNIDTVVQNYVMAALWSTIDVDGAEADDALDQRFDASNLSRQATESIRCDCARFIAMAAAAGLLDVYADAADFGAWTAEERFGHDFWLTRNGHGTGFWDREFLPDGIGDALTDICKGFGESAIYPGDDGALYVSPRATPVVLP